MTVADLGKGQKFKVVRVTLKNEVGKRLADMGFVQGSEGHVVRSAVLGGPLQVKICHYDVSLRRTEALGVEVVEQGLLDATFLAKPKVKR